MTEPAILHEVRRIACGVVDPELPPLTLADLGIFRGAELDDDGTVVVRITPTYSGCPALDAIAEDLHAALAAAGWSNVTVRRELSPAWTTDRITAEGRRKLAALGVAPPNAAGGVVGGAIAVDVRCPRCGSRATELLSRFSSTNCKALYRCLECAEPFEHFKAL